MPASDEEPEIEPRQCGRCRAFFAGDPDQPANAIAEWWACPPCREALFRPKSGP